MGGRHASLATSTTQRSESPVMYAWAHAVEIQFNAGLKLDCRQNHGRRVWETTVVFPSGRQHLARSACSKRKITSHTRDCGGFDDPT